MQNPNYFVVLLLFMQIPAGRASGHAALHNDYTARPPGAHLAFVLFDVFDGTQSHKYMHAVSTLVSISSLILGRPILPDYYKHYYKKACSECVP